MEKIFKAKRLDNGEWYVFGLFDIAPSVTGELWAVDYGEAIYLDKNTICQYTGMNDSEGNRIFEGDELELWIGHESYNGTVNHQDGIDYPAFDIDSVYDDIDNIECNKLSYFCCEEGVYMKLSGHNIHDRG